MDKNYQIYQAPDDQVSEEDKARLDGYLKGRSEADQLMQLEEYKKRFEEIIQEKFEEITVTKK